MEHVMTCWAGCTEDVTIHVNATRGSDEITEGIPIRCPECSEPYKFTMDGDGEPELESPDPDQLGENVSGPGADEVSHGLCLEISTVVGIRTPDLDKR